MNIKNKNSIYFICLISLIFWSCSNSNKNTSLSSTNNDSTVVQRTPQIEVSENTIKDTSSTNTLNNIKAEDLMPVVNNNYRLSVQTTFEDKQGITYRLLRVSIENLIGTFPNRALQEYIEITDGTTVEYPFVIKISPNQKRLIGLYAMDAFDTFTGMVKVRFGYHGGESITFDSVSINTIILPLPSVLDHLVTTDVTKASISNW